MTDGEHRRQSTRSVRRGASWLHIFIAIVCSTGLRAAHGIEPLSAGVTHGQPPAAGLGALDVFIGRWEGTSEGKPGTGTVEREYSRVLGSRFVKVRNVSTYPPQEKNPKGETHEDVGLFSFDSARKRLVFRQFHVEGFVNQYVANIPATAGVLVFTSEAIENIPAGWRARETYTISASDRMEERFELAAHGKEFELYSRARLTRAR